MRKNLLVVTLGFAFAFLTSQEAATTAHAAESRRGWGGNQLGILTGRSAGELEVAAIAENASVLTGTRFRTYGARTMRIEVGTGVSIASMGKGGASALLPPSKTDRGLKPLLGIELSSFEFSVSTNDERMDFLEWAPMISAGTFLSTGGCRAMILGRGGLSVGTIGLENGIRPSVGAGLYTNCRKVAFSTELSFIYSDQTEPATLASGILNYSVGDRSRIGLRFEALATEEAGGLSLPTGSRRVEARSFVTFAQSFTTL